MRIVDNNQRLRQQNDQFNILMATNDTEIDINNSINDAVQRNKLLKKLEIIQARQIQNQSKHELAAAFEILRNRNGIIVRLH